MKKKNDKKVLLDWSKALISTPELSVLTGILIGYAMSCSSEDIEESSISTQLNSTWLSNKQLNTLTTNMLNEFGIRRELITFENCFDQKGIPNEVLHSFY